MSELSDLTLKIFDREQTGRNANNKIRSAGRIPVILYGKEINKPFLPQYNLLQDIRQQ